MADPVTIQLGVPGDQITAAAWLYCEAFEQKLSPFLGPVERTAPFLARFIRVRRAYVALRLGEVVGIAGFKQDGVGLFEPTFGGIWREYSLTAPIRALGLALLERREDPDSLLMDGVAVRADARGQGIGTMLLTAIEDHARLLSRNNVRLDVIDTNARARRLYERNGYRAGKTSDIGPLRLVFPFRQTTEMRKSVA